MSFGLVYFVFTCTNPCIGNNDSKCYSYSSYIYLHVEANNGKGLSRFYSFCVQVDKFSKLSLNQSFAFMNENENSWIRVHAPPFVAVSQKIGNNTEDRRYFFNQRVIFNFLKIEQRLICRILFSFIKFKKRSII